MPSSAGVAPLPRWSQPCHRKAVHRDATRTEVERRVEPAEGEREPDEQEAHEAEAEDGEVRAHHVGSVLLLCEAGLDEREACLHEDHQDSADDHPQQVDLETEGGRCVDLLLGESDVGDDDRESGRATNGADESKRTFAHGSSLRGRNGNR
jgi:hypothetical protein